MAFAVFYGIISFRSRYYGEMITYLGMSAPIAVASVVTWLRHSCKGKDVKVNSLSPREYLGLFGAGLIVSFVFFFILRAFHTSRLIVSTVSVLTSFLASYLTMRRSAYYAVAYAANDVVLRRFMDPRFLERGPVIADGDLFSRLSGERSLRFFQLVEDGKAAVERVERIPKASVEMRIDPLPK